MIQNILIQAVCVGGGLAALICAAGANAGDNFDPASLKRFTEGVPYLGKYETGLYPGAKNVIPESHRKAGERVAKTIRPLDTSGKPDEQNGRILALVMGHSNCRMYFTALSARLREKAAELHPRFEMLNAAVGGQQLPQIVQLQGPVWDQARKLTTQPGYSPLQAQVLFLHTTYHGANNPGRRPPGEFPQTMRHMERDLATVLEHGAELYPNLKIAYLTCDGFRHFTGFEPHVWQEAFALKWIIEDQIKQERGAAPAPVKDKLPILLWGPYIWDNAWDRSYFTDGVHPAPKAQLIFAEKYWDHLVGDPVAKPWFLKP